MEGFSGWVRIAAEDILIEKIDESGVIPVSDSGCPLITHGKAGYNSFLTGSDTASGAHDIGPEQHSTTVRDAVARTGKIGCGVVIKDAEVASGNKADPISEL